MVYVDDFASIKICSNSNADLFQTFNSLHIIWLTLSFLNTALNLRPGGGGEGGQLPPPSLVRNINYSGNFYLRVGQSSCSCFVSLIFLIFSFHLSLAPCIKTYTKTQEMALKRPYFSKFSWGACPRTPLKILAPLARVGQIRVAPPQKKISKPARPW